MNLSTLDNVLWAASLIGHAALLLVLVLQKRAKDFPVFTFFVSSEVFRTMLLFLVLRYGTKHGYFVAYWTTGFANYVFQVAVIYEIARDVLRPTGAWVHDARKAFLGWGTAGMVVAAIIASQLGQPQSKGFDLWDSRITVFTSLLTCELFIAMAMAATRLGLQWRSHVVAIGQGIATWAVVALIEDFGHGILGWNREFVVFVHIRMFVYLSVLVYWIVAFWFPETVRAPLSAEMSAYLVALHDRVQYDLDSMNGPSL